MSYQIKCKKLDCKWVLWGSPCCNHSHQSQPGCCRAIGIIFSSSRFHQSYIGAISSLHGESETGREIIVCPDRMGKKNTVNALMLGAWFSSWLVRPLVRDTCFCIYFSSRKPSQYCWGKPLPHLFITVPISATAVISPAVRLTFLLVR